REVTSARGVPLDLMIYPRKESFSYLATKVKIQGTEPFVIWVASSGSARLIWDGADAAASQDDHSGLVFDRLAAKIETSAGEHLLAVKVCAGALDDDGRIRVRATDAAGKSLDLSTSAPAAMKA